MGTPLFAVPTLEALHAAHFPIRLVVTQPDRPKGRGCRLAPPPVKIAARALGYPVDQPSNVRDSSFIRLLEEQRADFLVVVAFGQILPSAILQIPKNGAVNVHASLLPRYRGPAPIQWAILRGESETGITTMLMDRGVDTGDILLQAKTTLKCDDTAQSLHDRLALMGAELLPKTLINLWEGRIFPTAQKHAEATYAPMLRKEDGRILWHLPAKTLDAHVRAMTPWPGAFCYLAGRRLKVLKARALACDHQALPGTVLPGFADELRVAAGDGALSLENIQSPSGKRMSIKHFLHGHPITMGEQFS